ncbi:MAG: polyketide synthase dehydratase domain-containing protein [Kiritimatiellae bacterium]|nr:polyketide synthase dehydratase domain-containing protein [Kiritimatiellia bacterium]
MSNERHLTDTFDSELCVVAAPNREALCDEIQRVIHFLEHAPDVRLADVAYTLACSSRHMPAVLSIVARTPGELRDRLSIALSKLRGGAARIRDKGGMYYFKDHLYPGGRIAFFFPGAISFYPDILRDLCLNFDVCRESFEDFQEALAPVSVAAPCDPADYIFPPGPSFRREGDPFSTQNFAVSFFAVQAANAALYRLFSRLGVLPDGLVGFSGGDFAALDVAGVYGNLSRDKRVVFYREGFQMLDHLMAREDFPRCGMIAISDPPEGFVDKLLAEYPGRITVAFYPCPGQLTLAVSTDSVKAVSEKLARAGVKSIRIPSTRPFNTPWCAKVLPPIKQFLAPWIRYAPNIPIYSCATCEPLPDAPHAINRLIVDQWTEAIHLDWTVNRMYEDGFRFFVEIGARGNMVTAISETLKGKLHQAVAVNRIHRSGLNQLHHALAILAAQGVPVDLTPLHLHRDRRELDLDRPLLSVSAPDPNTVKLAQPFPSFHVFSPSDEFLTSSHATPEETRKAMPVLRDRRPLEFGADFPMLAHAEIIQEEPGVSLEVRKTLSLDDYPFLCDNAIGTSQLSYAEPSLRGLTVLSMISGLELMAEAARKIVPKRRIAEVGNLRAQRWIGFTSRTLSVTIRSERTDWKDSSLTAVRVQLREDTPNNAYTSPVMEATILFAAGVPTPPIAKPSPLPQPRPVNWTPHDIYPDRLFQGPSLQIIQHVDLWSMGGIDFEVKVPRREGTVRYTRMPLFSVWPLLLDGVVSAFSLWRSHEKFAGAISLPFRCRRITFHTLSFQEGATLRGYLRLKAVTPRSHVSDIQVSDGKGNLLIEFRACEELCERVPPEYQQFILRPSEKFITHPLPLDLLGNPKVPVAASFASNIPVAIFEPHQELWLKALAGVLLSETEREEWSEMQGSTSRRLEWLFGRAVAKEATRRFLAKYHQAHWTGADIPIWADDSGKPHPLGAWREHTNVQLDLSITHTQNLIVAAVIANGHIGIDVEQLGRNLTEEFTRGVFTQEELELAAKTGEGPDMILRFWCAKEALSKALGTGIRFSPLDLRILSVDVVSGKTEMELKGQWLEAFKSFRGRKSLVYTSVYLGHAFASCVLPLSLFEPAKV